LREAEKGSLINSRSPLVTETCRSVKNSRHAFFQRYDTNLPTSLASVTLSRLGFFRQQHLSAKPSSACFFLSQAFLSKKSFCTGSRYGHLESDTFSCHGAFFWVPKKAREKTNVSLRAFFFGFPKESSFMDPRA